MAVLWEFLPFFAVIWHYVSFFGQKLLIFLRAFPFQNQVAGMKIKVLHLWAPAAILYVLAVFMAFFQEPVIASLFTIGYMSLLICTKWAID